MYDDEIRVRALADGIAGGDLRLRFQPLVGAHSRLCVGFEALVRWQHPQQGLLGPERFVPLAEHGQLIVPLTEWVLEEAVAACAAWHVRGLGFGVSVNISARSLCDAGLVDQVAEKLDRHRLSPDALTLEITESALVERPDVALEMVTAWRRLGVRVSVDDFGTGFTSLAMLRDFEFDELKIDGSFVAGMLHSPADAAIVHSILELGHRLGLEVVAERVESAALARQLATYGCDVLQGFHFSGPLELDAALAVAGGLVPSAADANSRGAVVAPIPASERARLAALHALDLLDADPDPDLDDVVAIAAAVCGTSVGLVTLVDDDRQWFAARVGLDTTETDRDSAFCAHAILHDTVMEIPDALGDARFATNPLVTGAPNIRFYAGAPLITDDGHALGTLCVLDAAPQTLDDSQRDTLRRLAAIVMAKLEARRNELVLRRLTASLMELSQLHDPCQATHAADTIVHVARRLLSADGAVLMLADTAGGVLYRPFGMATDLDVAAARDLVIDIRTDPTALEVTRSRKPLFVPDAAHSGLVDRDLAALLHAASFLYVPVTDRDEVVGGLVIWWSEARAALDTTSLDAAALLAAETGTTLSRLRALAALREAAETDPLTGLANRRSSHAALRQLPVHSTIALIDLDNFKAINDRHGHQAGDQALKSFAAHLRRAVRNGDLAGRWGGEEFIVVLPSAGIEAGTDMLARLRQTWTPPAAQVTFSTGLALRHPGETVDQLLARADSALNAAKDQGRNCDISHDDHRPDDLEIPPASGR